MLAMKSAKAEIKMSPTHINIKKRIIKLIERDIKAKTNSLPAVRREWVYLRNVIFQYFIGLMKLGIENQDKKYHFVYNKIGDLVSDSSDEIDKVLSMIDNSKIGS